MPGAAPGIAHARDTSSTPNINFEIMDMAYTPYTDGSFAGILAWYSLIHTRPAHLTGTLTEFYRLLIPGGFLLLGMFLGEHGLPFAHAVTTAYYVSVPEFSALCEKAGHVPRAPRGVIAFILGH